MFQRVFQRCFKEVSRKLSRCFKKVSCFMALIAASRAEGGLVKINVLLIRANKKVKVLRKYLSIMSESTFFLIYWLGQESKKIRIRRKKYRNSGH